MKAESTKATKSDKSKAKNAKTDKIKGRKVFKKKITMIVSAIFVIVFGFETFYVKKSFNNWVDNDADYVRSYICDDKSFKGSEGEKAIFFETCNFRATDRINQIVNQNQAQIAFCTAMCIISLLFFLNAAETRE